ncbi:methionine--tRNA ligase [Sphingomicrobium sp. XHP0239]|uniref:methionine--tRNA ligase n=1 Tax=Sphingomicrobium maritimum TaxID=3133972 RepID=UPI0031CC975C
MSQPYYLSTAISYPNGAPHIGHAYEAIAADVMARFRRGQGRDVYFQTGTDEHGLKMAQTAREQGIEPAELGAKMSSMFKVMCDDLNISYDRFIRTTDEDHHAASRAIWRAMEANGDLYKDRYEGWYSVRDEAFYDEKEIVEGEGGAKLSPQGTPVEWQVEESWFFKLSKYEKPLLEHIAAHPDFIRPTSRRNEIVAFIEGGLRDLSVSRASLDWGVKVPGDEDHVMYVWVDALTNYITGVGYPGGGERWDRFWPADCHLIGKDIIRFHAVYWPAFLMSAGIDLPRQVYAHGFLLGEGGVKMSKSLGNVVDPMGMARTHGVDSLRYYLLREVSFGQDGSVGEDSLVTRVNAELANSFGNLAQRTLSMIHKNLDGAVPPAGDASEDRALLETVRTACEVELPAQFEAWAFEKGIEAWLRAVYACNAYVDEQAPWALKKSDPERMAAVLGTLAAAIEPLADAIAPVVPTGAKAVLDQLVPGEDGKIAKPVPVFPRLEIEEVGA